MNFSKDKVAEEYVNTHRQMRKELEEAHIILDDMGISKGGTISQRLFRLKTKIAPNEFIKRMQNVT